MAHNLLNNNYTNQFYPLLSLNMSYWKVLVLVLFYLTHLMLIYQSNLLYIYIILLSYYNPKILNNFIYFYFLELSTNSTFFLLLSMCTDYLILNEFYNK